MPRSATRLAPGSASRCAALAIAALLLDGRWAVAGETDDSRVMARLDFSAPEGCGSVEELSARVRRRTKRIEITPAAEEARLVKAGIVHAGEHWLVVSLSIAQPDGAPAVRRFRSRTCAEALNALGLVIAITLDPSCAGNSEPELPFANAAGEPPAPPPVETITAPQQSEPPPSRLDLGVAATGQAVRGAGPRVMPGGALQVELALDRASLLSPALRLVLVHVARDGYGATGGSADFSLDSLGLGLCPLQFRVGRLAARPCGTASVGRLSAAGSDTFNAESHNRLFLTLGGEVVMTLRLVHRVEILGSFGAAAPLIRDSFQFSPAVFYKVPAVGWNAGLGLGMRFL